MSPVMYEEFGATTSAYWATKAGVEALTHYMAGIGGKHNIRVNCVRPGQIMTSGARGGTLHDPDGDITSSRSGSIGFRLSNMF